MYSMKRKLHPNYLPIATSLAYVNGVFITQKDGWLWLQGNQNEVDLVNRTIDRCIPIPKTPSSKRVAH
jgi:hypothetical protein